MLGRVVRQAIVEHGCEGVMEEPLRKVARKEYRPRASRGDASGLHNRNQEVQVCLQQRPGQWRQCPQCAWARYVPDDCRQARCLSMHGGFNGPWRCFAQPRVAGWSLSPALSQQDVEGHNRSVQMALAKVQSAMSPPVDEPGRLRFLQAVRHAVSVSRV